ncbi:MAG: phosphatidylserine/phosphatidylglycerophosphate/cardiolipin synthase family protein [Spirochaetales bacterium]|nr:phosphatidylserine/phosphatidylglycerophosphate/cardiolipin synthase family protein [Candidatus Physcosoma equi]
MKKTFAVLSMVLLLLVSSCTSTRAFVSDYTLDPSIPLEAKLEAYGGKQVSVDMPETYFSGPEWLARMVELVNESEDYILVSTFLGSSCPSLEPLYEALARKAEEGVRVYYIIDGTSEEDMTESRFVMTPLYFLRDRGVKVLSYSPLSFMNIFKPVGYAVRDHRKLMVFDGKIAVVGGMNTNFISMGAGEESQRDSMYVFHSSSLASLLIEEFASIWNSSSIDKVDPSSFARYEDKESAYRAWLFNRNVYHSNVSVSGMFGSLFAEAKESIMICPFLPMMDKNMKESLNKASQRGVDVEIYMSIDPRGYVRKGSSYNLLSLLEEAGATVYNVSNDEEGNELPLYHIKVEVVDNRYVVIGSSNLNYRSMTLSHELALLVDSPELAQTVTERAKEIGRHPVEMTEDEARRMKEEDSSFLFYLFTYYGG